MKNPFILICLFVLVSCGHIKFDPFIKPDPPAPAVPVRDPWIGRSIESLDLHPVYATKEIQSRKSSEGIEVRTYKNYGAFASSGNCIGGGCSSTGVQVVCNHVFYIKEKKIIDRVRVGHCGEEDPNFRPI